jgi:hypothetical protein
MRQKSKPKRRSPKSVLRLPDIDHSKTRGQPNSNDLGSALQVPPELQLGPTTS